MNNMADWRDIAGFVSLPRLGGLVLGDNGTLMVSVASLDAKQTGNTSCWWRLDLSGQLPPQRLTRGTGGESFGACLPGGDFVFGAKRDLPAKADGEPSEDVSALWLLPATGGEAYPIAQRSGGYSRIITAARSDVMIALAPTHLDAADEDADADKRARRREHQVSAILHEAYPVRFWDHDLGPVANRLLRLDLDSGAERTASAEPLTGEVGRCLDEGDWSLSADGSTLVVDWAKRRFVYEIANAVIAIDTATGDRTVLAQDDQDGFGQPVISADASLIACVRIAQSSAQLAPKRSLWLTDRQGNGRALAADWDRWAAPIAFSPDNQLLYVSADDDGHHPLFAIDLSTDEVRRLTDFGAFSAVQLSADGSTLYAVRSSYLDPGTVVAVDTTTGEVAELWRPVDYPELPGRLERVETTTADGVRVPGWLVLPETASADDPAPLALWVHGGPLNSWNAWSWRWTPWLLAARGWAVLLPDPALSTGYGQAVIQRGWARWGQETYADLMAITDETIERADIDATRAVAMGGSFGGYMVNWIAGHTDRFRAIVSHAGLWNLSSFNATTDAAWYWVRELTEQMRRDNSPHHSLANITTPMLVIHGDKDYRVPLGEGLALWWDLTSNWAGEEADFPHKFLYFPDENHWILRPNNAKIWYETVLAFIEAGIGGQSFQRSELL